MSDVTRGCHAFMLAQFIVMFLLVAFPSIVEFAAALAGWLNALATFSSFGLASFIPYQRSLP